jgi:hypothetical protein
MQEHKCLIDNTVHPTLPDLHSHLRKLKWKQADYYESFFPKKDLLTGEKIPFKDLRTYFKVDFLNKNNLNKWARANPVKAVEWTKKYIAERKKEKGLVYAPSHFELRTLFCPSVKFLQEHTDYNKMCESIGLKPRFDYVTPLVFNPLPANFKVFCDTREQAPLKFIKSEVKKLDYGDYTLSEGNSNIFIERKSISDAVSTMSQGYERFYREVERARNDDAYLIVAVEVDYNTFQSFHKDYRMRYAKVSPEHILKIMRGLLLDFDNLQFVFCDGRVKLTETILKIYQLGEQVKTTDLQMAVERGLI